MKKKVELLAPVGTWKGLEAVIEAGADSVYLGGKQFNMRLHRQDVNLTDLELSAAVEFAHAHQVDVHVTVNNLISEEEIPLLKEYLQYLEEIKPDALIVQDLAIFQLAKEMSLSIPLHSSVMLNTHNEHAIPLLKKYGATRVVLGRELNLEQIGRMKEKHDVELEYFIHGDMCIAHSGQCYHSGVVFGQSSNRGRCMKPCRWQFDLWDASAGEMVASEQGAYRLAMKDMCMYRNLPELIQSGVDSFKIEGRMRDPQFMRDVVGSYRRAIDRYLSDPMGYVVDEAEWEEVYRQRSRDVSCCYAFGNPGKTAIGYSGKREPRLFSKAIEEAGSEQIDCSCIEHTYIKHEVDRVPKLSVRVADLASFVEAANHGADRIYIGGEAYQPQVPWRMQDIEKALSIAEKSKCKVIVLTPRITMERECKELTSYFQQLTNLNPHGIMIGNVGLLQLAKDTTNLPLYADYSMNVLNHISAQWLQDNRVVQATVSIEASLKQVKDLQFKCELPLEMIIHGPLDAMVMEHNLVAADLDIQKGAASELLFHQYNLIDAAGHYRPIRVDQYGRTHLLFGKDLCLLPALPYLLEMTSWRVEGQHYSASVVKNLTLFYREILDNARKQPRFCFNASEKLEQLKAISPRELGAGAFKFKASV